MSGWKDDDEVTTTYGSIQLSLEQAHAAGIKTEQERIIKVLEKYALRECDPECGYSCECFGKYEAMHFIECIRETALIKGEANE